ncbi:MAG: hypothetical protein RBR06_09470 [Desulfuromonadaceae bacterium]|nr:hypothetical protein [Desulfuromonadaceae bacterium]
MENEKNTYGTDTKQLSGETGSVSDKAHSIMDQGAKVYGQAEQAASDAYDKTVETVSQTYAQAKNYSTENPGKTILITLGIGIGLGLLLGASSRGSRTGRYAQPVINALSDVAHEFFS